MFVKINAAAEDAGHLPALQQLLQSHGGPLPVVLFYESTQKTIALSERYHVKPSPELFAAIERLLGDGSVKVR